MSTSDFKKQLSSALQGQTGQTITPYDKVIEDFSEWIEETWLNVKTANHRNITNPIKYLYVRGRLSMESLVSLLVYKSDQKQITLLNRPDKIEGDKGTTYSTLEALQKSLLDIASNITFKTQMGIINSLADQVSNYEGYIHTQDYYEIVSNDIKIELDRSMQEKVASTPLGKTVNITCRSTPEPLYNIKMYDGRNVNLYKLFEVSGFLGVVQSLKLVTPSKNSGEISLSVMMLTDPDKSVSKSINEIGKQ
jgi:hypothetical protein